MPSEVTSPGSIALRPSSWRRCMVSWIALSSAIWIAIGTLLYGLAQAAN